MKKWTHEKKKLSGKGSYTLTSDGRQFVIIPDKGKKIEFNSWQQAKELGWRKK